MRHVLNQTPERENISMEKRKFNSGFTLIEVVVGAVILSIMTVVLWEVFITFRRMNEVSTWQSARQIQLKKRS